MVPFQICGSTPVFTVNASHTLNVHFYCARISKESRTPYECGISAHKPFLSCVCMCTGMIQCLEWLLSYPITVAGILNLYLNFCQRWYLTLFKLGSLLLFFLKQHSSREESSQGWCCPAFPWVDVQVAWHTCKTQFYSAGQKKFHIPVQRLPSGSACQ